MSSHNQLLDAKSTDSEDKESIYSDESDYSIISDDSNETNASFDFSSMQNALENIDRLKKDNNTATITSASTAPGLFNVSLYSDEIIETNLAFRLNSRYEDLVNEIKFVDSFDAPLAYNALLRCNHSRLSFKITNLFDFLNELLLVVNEMKDNIREEKYWLSYAFESGSDRFTFDAFELLIGNLESPYIFSIVAEWKFDSLKIENVEYLLSGSIGKPCISVDSSGRLYFRMRHPFCFVQPLLQCRRKTYCTRIQIDLKEVIAVIFTPPGSFLFVFRRPPSFFQEIDDDGDIKSFRIVVSNYSNIFQKRLSYSVKLSSKVSEQVVTCLRHYNVRVFHGLVKSQFKRNQEEKLYLKVKRNIFSYFPFLIFQSEYPWLAHHVLKFEEKVKKFLLFCEKVKQYNKEKDGENLMKQLKKPTYYETSPVHWEYLITTLEYFERNVVNPLFFTDCTVARMNVLFPTYFEKLESKPNVDKLVMPPGMRLTHSIYITPSGRVLMERPIPKLSNRIIRNFHVYDNHSVAFARLSFVDEDRSPVVDNEALIPIINQIFSEGLHIGDIQFRLLHWSNSQLRKKGMWLVGVFDLDSGRGSDIRTKELIDEIRAWVGKLPDPQIKGVAKYCSKFALAFSSSIPTIFIPHTQMQKINDIVKGDYIFTDGVGQISLNCARQVSEAMGLEDSVPPSAFQFRLGGCKGVLSLRNDLDHQIALRPSQMKFNSNYNLFEVLSYSKFNPCYLNQQIIFLLKARGVADSVILELMSDALERASKLITDPKVAAAKLSEMGFNDIFERINCFEEPFFRSLLQYQYRVEIGRLLRKTAIPVPEGANLIGIADEFGVLGEEEVFLQLRSDEGVCQKISGFVIITKNPCMHPADILKLKAVSSPNVTQKLGHLFNVIVFPTNIYQLARPYTDMITGSDLDGDSYFVSWNSDLMGWNAEYEPLDYNSLSKAADDGDQEPPDSVLDYYIRSCSNTSLGIVANAHKVHADYQNLGAASPECVELAKLHAVAVDYPKTGIPISLDPSLLPKEYPQWMNKKDKPMYLKNTILQKCSDLCPKIDDIRFSVLGHETKLSILKPNPALIKAGYHLFLEDSKHVMQQYNDEITRIMQLNGLEHEAEVFANAIQLHRNYSRHDRASQEEYISWEMKRLNEKYRNIFFEGCSEYTLDQLQQKASCWYIVAYEHQRENLKALGSNEILSGSYKIKLSFGWLMSDILSEMVKSNKLPSRDLSSPMYSNIGISVKKLWKSFNLLKRIEKVSMIADTIENKFGCDTELFQFSNIVFGHWIDVTFNTSLYEIDRENEREIFYLLQTIFEGCKIKNDVLEIPEIKCRFSFRKINQDSISSKLLDIFYTWLDELNHFTAEIILQVLHVYQRWIEFSFESLTTTEESLMLTFYFLFIFERFFTSSSQDVDSLPNNDSELIVLGLSSTRKSQERRSWLLKKLKFFHKNSQHQSPNSFCGELIVDFFNFLKRSVSSPIDISLRFKCATQFLKLSSLFQNGLGIDEKNKESIFINSSRTYYQLLFDENVIPILTKFAGSSNSYHFKYVFNSVPEDLIEWLCFNFKELIQKDGKVSATTEHFKSGVKLFVDVISNRQKKKAIMQLCRNIKSDLKRIKNFSKRIMDHNQVDVSKHTIDEHKDIILKHMNENQVLIIKSGTGTGKSTRIPKIILDARQHLLTKIIIFQPTRVATVSLASRLSQTLNSELGEEVGYIIGGDTNITRSTRIIFCTNAIGMMQCLQEFIPYSHVIIDEIHNRKIYDEVSMATMKYHHLICNQKLKLILMSADANTTNLSHFFGDKCKILDLTLGSPFPIEIKYIDEIEFFLYGLRKNTNQERIQELVNFVQKSHGKVCLKHPIEVPYFPLDVLGDFILHVHRKLRLEGNLDSEILIFLPGRRDIFTLAMIMDDLKQFSDEYTVIHLMGTLSMDQQLQATHSGSNNVRKIILSTDVVESSVTIPEISVIIDTLTHKRMRNIGNSREKHLSLEFISKDEALQRTGRTGRTKPGKVYRLVRKSCFEDFEKHPVPEIIDANIVDILLVLKEFLLYLGENTTHKENFSDPSYFLQNMIPAKLSSTKVNNAYEELNDMGVFQTNRHSGLTPLGKIMKEVYFDAYVVLLVVNGLRYGVLDDAIILAAILQRGSPFLNGDQFDAKTKKHLIKLKIECGKGKSDLFSQMYAFLCWRMQNKIRKEQKKKKETKMKGRKKHTEHLLDILADEDIKEEDQWCWNHFLSVNTLREIEEVYFQIYDSLTKAGCFSPPDSFSIDRIEMQQRHRRARQIEYIEPGKELVDINIDICIQDFKKLLSHKQLFSSYEENKDLVQNFSFSDRENVLLWIIAATFSKNIFTTELHFAKEVKYTFENKAKRLKSSLPPKQRLCSFLKKLNLGIVSAQTMAMGRECFVEFETEMDAQIASNLVSLSSDYPYKSVDQKVVVTAKRACFSAVEGRNVVIKETASYIAGECTLVARKVLLNEGKNGHSYLCFDITTLPLGIDAAVYAATYPSYPNCRFNGEVESMNFDNLYPEVKNVVTKIRKNLDKEFEPCTNSTFFVQSKCHLKSNAYELIKSRRKQVLLIMKFYSQKAKIMKDKNKITKRKLHIPRERRGRVIGKKGSTIKAIQNSTNTSIQLCYDKEIAIITGSESAVALADFMIRKKIES